MVVTYTDEVFLKYKTIYFTDRNKLDGSVGLACLIEKMKQKKLLSIID